MSQAPRNTRWLYLLALFQLVAGPLVLTQVMVFCKITVENTAEQGVITAAVEALQSEEFNASLDAAAGIRQEQPNSDRELPRETKASSMKIIGTPWAGQLPALVAEAPKRLNFPEYRRRWTPTGLSAPPGPPPRLA